MKKIVFLLGVLLFSALGTTQAAGRAAEIVAGVSAAFRAMKSYSVDFEVTMGEHRMVGNYAVCGETYRIVLGDAEVWFDGKTRHEIDNRRNILNNPVRAFDFIGGEYLPSLLRERDGEAVVLLEPAGDGGMPAGSVTLVVATATMRPRSLDYDFDGERVTVRILGIEPLRKALPAFDRSAFAAYEWIDFR